MTYNDDSSMQSSKRVQILAKRHNYDCDLTHKLSPDSDFPFFRNLIKSSI